jgi:hypothetical protein
MPRALGLWGDHLDQTTAYRQNQRLGHQSLLVIDVRVWACCDSTPKCLHPHAATCTEDPEKNGFGQLSVLGQLIQYPCPRCLVNGLHSGWEFVERLLSIIGAGALTKGLQLKPGMEEPVKGDIRTVHALLWTCSHPAGLIQNGLEDFGPETGAFHVDQGQEIGALTEEILDKQGDIGCLGKDIKHLRLRKLLLERG